MKLASIRIQNFRCVQDETLHCNQLTALLGRNGSGKSTFLRALDLFYSATPKADEDDYYNKDSGQPFVITLTFKELNAEAQSLFQKYIQADTLTIERVFSFAEGKCSYRYHGSTLQNPDFKPIRDAFEIKDRAATAKGLYTALRSQAKYASMQAATTKEAMQEAMENWEAANKTQCVPARDDGQFFGFQSVGRGNLSKFTKFLFIPAVRDASEDANDGKGSAANTLMDMVVRSKIAARSEITDFQEEAQAKYKELLDPANLPELGNLQTELNSTLGVFAPGAEVDLKWQNLRQLQLPLPDAELRLAEDGYASVVGRTGHGLQRAFILTLLQHLAKAQSEQTGADSGTEPEAGVTATLPNFLIAIEEPELYQHPSRQRYLAKILEQLTAGGIPGVAQVTQILYCTHSPLFVRVDQFDNIRILRKVATTAGLPKTAKIFQVSLQDIAAKLATLDGSTNPYTPESVAARLHAIMTPLMNEGFFSESIVLVEGEDDRTAILAMAQTKGVDLESKGTAVIPCIGKANIDRPYLIFTQFGIPVYTVWDGDAHLGATSGLCPSCGRPLDKKADPALNRHLLKMVGRTEEDWPEFVDTKAACFKHELEHCLLQEAGQSAWDEAIDECMNTTGITKHAQAKKKPVFYELLVTSATRNRTALTTLSDITDKIIQMS